MTIALSSHGTLVARALAATPTVFTTIAELQDVNAPELMRNEFDATTQNINIDAYVLGVLRRGATVLSLNFLHLDGSHDHLTGLTKAIIDNSIDGYKFTFPDGVTVTHSGQVQHIAEKDPVDGKMSADVTIRFSGKFLINSTVIGN